MGLDIDLLRTWIGKSEAIPDVATAAPVRALSATLDRDDPFPQPGDALPACRHWLYFAREDLMCHELRGRTLGLVDMSEIGRRAAALGRALGMRVLGFDPAVDAAELERRGAEAVSFDELLRQSDIVSLHCPRNAHTVGMMNAARFAAMKPGSIFITTARSGIHDEAALAEALASGHLAGAGLDVWDQEPPPPEHPLLRLPNVVATYHSAGVTHEARRNNATLAATQIAQLLTTGQRPERLVNRDVWPRASARLAALGHGRSE